MLNVKLKYINLTKQIKQETICHEMVHGILVHLGYEEYSQNEQFVQTLRNVVYQEFEVKGNKE